MAGGCGIVVKLVEVVDEKNGWPVRFLGGGGGLGGGLDEICWETKMEVFPHGSWHCVSFFYRETDKMY